MHFNLTDPTFLLGVAVIVVLIVIAGVLYGRKQKQNTAGLRTRFGPEYDQAVLSHGSERKAKSKLEARETRVENLNLRDLDAAERERFMAEWRTVQSLPPSTSIIRIRSATSITSHGRPVAPE